MKTIYTVIHESDPSDIWNSHIIAIWSFTDKTRALKHIESVGGITTDKNDKRYGRLFWLDDHSIINLVKSELIE